jgi:type VI secretion system secreted protein VgrG
MNDPFSTISKALPPGTRVLAFRGTEALSTLYQFELYLLIEDPAFDMAAAVGADATLSLNREDALEPPVLYHGILATLETVRDLQHGALYRAVLVPHLYRLTLTHHSRVFVDQGMPAILEAVLTSGGLAKERDFSFQLSARYAPYPHVCQYRESSFAFLARRMEREGVYYFFEQEDDHERVVITDHRSFHRPLAREAVRWVTVTGTGAKGGNGLRSFTCKHASIPGKVRVKDYDYLKPALDVSGEAKASGWDEEIFLHAENAATPEDSRRLAELRAEELLARRVVWKGVGRGAVFLRPGYTFTVEDHPRFDGDYLAVELEHFGKQGQLSEEVWEMLGQGAERHDGDDTVYRFDVVAIPARVQYRPERRTPVPRIFGLERAVVDGERDDHYAQLDEHGRYLVKIHFDESALENGKASTRIRMMQPHAGNPESFHFPLRKGTEVFLSFDGGDPDRPFIAGVAPNLHKPTQVTSQNHTRNILNTGGQNRILIEDLDRFQFVRISSPVHNSFLHLGSPNDSHNRISFTGGNALSATGYDSETSVGLSRLTVIGDFFYKQYLDKSVIANASQGAFSGPDKLTATPEGTFDHDPGVDPDPLMEEARDISPSQFDNPTVTASNPPAPVTEGDLNLTPAAMFRDPDGRSSYRVGSDLKYVLGDNVTKVEGDDLKAVFGDEKKHIHQASISHVDGGQLSVVTPTTTNIDIVKTALFVSQLSVGVTSMSVTALNATITGLSVKLAGFDITKVGMKLIQ